MSFLSRLFGARERVASPRADWAGDTIYIGDLNDPRIRDLLKGGKMTAAGVAVTPDNAMRVGAVTACVRLIARAAAMLPLQLFEAKGLGDNAQAKAHPLYGVLYRKPNRWQTAFEFRSLMQAHVLLRGNAYALKVNGARGEVRELIPLNPDRMTPRQLPDLSIVYDYQRPDGSLKTFKQAEIFHLRDLSSDGVKGMSVIAAAAEAIGISLQAERAAATMFKKGTLAGGAVKTAAALSETAFARLKADLEEKRSGAEHAGEWLILEEGLEPAQLGMSAVDLQFLETRAFQVDDIARLFGVPPHMIGSVQKSTSFGRGMEEQTIGFVVFTLQPHLTMWEQAIARDCLQDNEAERFFARHNVAALLRGSNDSRANYFKAALGAGGSPGWMTQNEVRGVEDLNRIEGNPAYDQLPEPTKPAAPDSQSSRQGDAGNDPSQDS